MIFEEAVKLLKEGKKVRLKHHHETVYYHLVEGVFRTANGNNVYLDGSCILATDWEEFKEQDDWNLKENNDNISRTVAGQMLEFTKKDVKKLKQKILEDIGYFLTSQNKASNPEYISFLKEELQNRINKRFGDK